MAWAKLDDKFWSHPKIRKAGVLAAGLYAHAISYASDHLTDGFIPGYMLPALADVARYAPPEEVVAALVEAGLWEPVTGGWKITQAVPWRFHADPKDQELRHTRAYKDWRAAVLARDGARCRECGALGTPDNPLHAHHMEEFSTKVALRFDVANGRTMCLDCHSREHGRRLG